VVFLQAEFMVNFIGLFLPHIFTGSAYLFVQDDALERSSTALTGS
jgi:hypothetical protein